MKSEDVLADETVPVDKLDPVTGRIGFSMSFYSKFTFMKVNFLAKNFLEVERGRESEREKETENERERKKYLLISRN